MHLAPPRYAVSLCRVKAFALVACLAIPLMFSQPTSAGTWSLHVTGSGSAHAKMNGQTLKTATWAAPADATGSVTLASLARGQACSTGNSSSADASLSATVTGTWVPDPNLPADPAPQSVIVTVQSTAYANDSSSDSSGNSTPAVAGTADDGLGQGDQQDTTPGDTNVGTVSGTKYTVDSGGSFTVSISPSASATATAGPSGMDPNGLMFMGHGMCSAGFGPVTVSTSTPEITLAGTYDPTHGDNRVLTGQQVTATFSGTIGTVTSYTWSVGGDTFKNYDTSKTNNDQLVPLGPADLTGPQPGHTGIADLPFYDKTQEPLTVNCAVTLTAPDGTTVLNVTAKSPEIDVKKPSANWPATGTFMDLSSANQYFTGNEVWGLVTISVPSPFSGGTGCFAQIVATPTASITRNALNGQPSTYSIKIPDGQGGWIAPGTGLDGTFPYANGFTTDSQGNPVQQITNGYTFTAGGYGLSGDAPKGQEALDPGDIIDNGGADWYSASASASFTTYLMYRPPGDHTVYIPLQSLAWSWTGTGSKPPGGSWTATGSVTTPVLGTDTTTFPTWSEIITGQKYRP